MTVTAHIESTDAKVKHEVIRAYRVSGDLVEFLPVDDSPDFRYRIIFNGQGTRQYTHKNPSAKVAVFFAEKIKNERYVIAN